MLKGQVEDVLNDPKCTDENEKSKFWVLAAALKTFIEEKGTFPVAGTLPDMTSTTDFFLDL